MSMTAAEQYFLELLNRARMAPAAEADRQDWALNQGLPLGTYGRISTAPKEVLAPQAQLDRAAEGHSSWMARTGNWSHTGEGDTTDWMRILAAGYTEYYTKVGENLASAPGRGTQTEFVMATHFNTLWESPTHRSNMMGGADLSSDAPNSTLLYREIGVAEAYGGSTDYLTLDFGLVSSRHYLTGVAYKDTDRDDFYSIGEAVGRVRFAIVGGSSDVTEAAGGYAISTTLEGVRTVRVTHAGATSQVKVDFGSGHNVKLDLEIDHAAGPMLLVNSRATLVGGPIADARLLGVQNLSLTGSGADNLLVGNLGKNVIRGGAGVDDIRGMAGADKLYGGSGSDSLRGGLGNDRLEGEGGKDRLWGDAGADSFVFKAANGRDMIRDFSIAQNDMLAFDDALWGGTALSKAEVVAQFASVVNGDVTFNFGPGEVVVLDNLSSTAGLADHITIL